MRLGGMTRPVTHRVRVRANQNIPMNLRSVWSNRAYTLATMTCSCMKTGSEFDSPARDALFLQPPSETIVGEQPVSHGASQSANLSCTEKIRSCTKIKSFTSGCRCCSGAAAIKYQPILTTSTGSLACLSTRHSHFVVYEVYKGLYQRLRLCVDNKSTKQSPIEG